MLVNETFHHILEEVQNSSLNFQLQVSPFSAIISLKKSFIKDKSGNLLMSQIQNMLLLEISHRIQIQCVASVLIPSPIINQNTLLVKYSTLPVIIAMTPLKVTTLVLITMAVNTLQYV